MAVRCFFLVALAVGFVPASAELFPGFYDLTCPDALATIKRVVEEAVQKEARMGASLLRLHFHDCFVNGCDGSVLLDDTPTFTGEKTALPNLNSARGFDVIDKIKSEVDLVCGPGVVSCADILAVAARDSVVVLGGPSWCVHVGRRDSTKASKPKANDSIPSPVMNLSALVSNFKSHGLGLRDLVALSGAHTIGQARCTLFRSHIYNDTNIDPGFAASLRTLCPQASVVDNNPAPLDVMTPIGFDNNYFKNLVEMKGLLSTDQELFNGGPADELVKNYSENLDIFWLDFGVSMVKMGDISPLIGSNGEIRMNCRKVN